MCLSTPPLLIAHIQRPITHTTANPRREPLAAEDVPAEEAVEVAVEVAEVVVPTEVCSPPFTFVLSFFFYCFVVISYVYFHN